ncbi:hypothetical protein [Streptomyces sp. NPDC056600]|uniref:hypothetical protein n=1 Tax=Streptomyces sp. NPDC056600 TaxID=3345874 RepID=UPI0036A77F9D
MLPEGWKGDELSQWLDLLERAGATAGLCDATLPAEERSPDGTAGWTHRFVALCAADYFPAPPPELYPSSIAWPTRCAPNSWRTGRS